MGKSQVTIKSPGGRVNQNYWTNKFNVVIFLLSIALMIPENEKNSNY